MKHPPSISLNRADKQFLGVFIFTSIIGFYSNSIRVSPGASMKELIREQGFIYLAAAILVLFVSWNLLRSRYQASDLGLFIQNRRAAILAVLSLAFLFCMKVYAPATPTNQFTPIVITLAILEEILYRPLLINVIRKIFSSSASSSLIAVVFSSFIWTLIHIPSKPVGQLPGIFIGGMLFAAMYTYSRSNVVGFTVHATANAGPIGGFTALGFYLLGSVFSLRKNVKDSGC